MTMRTPAAGWSRRFPALRTFPQALGAAIVLAAAFLSIPQSSRANETCPWLNEATAGGFLNATVATAVTHPGVNKNDAMCEFIHRDASGSTVLQIEVETMSSPATQFTAYEAKCGAMPEAIKAVGNEAVACSLAGKKDRFSVMVIGRVRDRAFTVRIESAGDNSTQATLRDRARRVAEQVAGFLF